MATDDVDEKQLNKVVDYKTGKVKAGHYTDNEGNLRVESGKQSCQMCGTNNNVLQLEMDTVKNGLPITEIMFCCNDCYENKLKK